jgi:hypothetical protein
MVGLGCTESYPLLSQKRKDSPRLVCLSTLPSYVPTYPPVVTSYSGTRECSPSSVSPLLLFSLRSLVSSPVPLSLLVFVLRIAPLACRSRTSPGEASAL